MEARRSRGAAMAHARTIGIRCAVAAVSAAALVWAHRTVSSAEATLSAAETRNASRFAEPPQARPPITASISTVAACRDERISLERCVFSWRPATSLAFVSPDLRIMGEAASADAVERFVDRLAEHAFLGDVSIATLRSRRDGAVEFEIALGDGPSTNARSIVVQGGER